MKNRGFRLLPALFLVLCLFMGCENATKSAADLIAAPSAIGGGFTEAVAAETAAPVDAAAPTIRNHSKHILSADISAETKDYATADAAIQSLTAQEGGYLETASVSGNEGNRRAHYIVRVPQECFQAFLNAFGQSCHVTDRSQSKEDVGQQYYDAETHVSTLKTKHERLLTLLARSEKMEDIVALENALSDTEYELEQYQGTLRQYDDLIGFSTIRIQLNEVSGLSAVPQGSGFLSELKTAAAAGLRGLTTAVRGFVLLCVAIWPLIIVLLLTSIVARRVYRKRRARKAMPHDNATEENTKK